MGERDDERRTDGWSLYSGADPQRSEKLELDRPPAENRGQLVDDVTLPGVRGRKRRRARKPSTFSWTMVILAAVGAGSIFVYLLRSMKESGPEIVQAALDIDLDKLLAEKAPVYRSVSPIVDGVLISVNVTPANARIFLDGRPIESNPLRVARGKKALQFVVWDVGYLPAKAKVVPAKDTSISLQLKKAPPASR